MKISLIIFGTIFLVIGVVLYFVPMQEFSAQTTSLDDGKVDSRLSSARVTIPTIWSSAFAIIGFFLLILGFILPGQKDNSDPKKEEYEKVVEIKEDIVLGNGNKRKIVRERTETHKSRKNDD